MRTKIGLFILLISTLMLMSFSCEKESVVPDENPKDSINNPNGVDSIITVKELIGTWKPTEILFHEFNEPWDEYMIVNNNFTGLPFYFGEVTFSMIDSKLCVEVINPNPVDEVYKHIAVNQECNLEYKDEYFRYTITGRWSDLSLPEDGKKYPQSFDIVSYKDKILKVKTDYDFITYTKQ